MSAPIRSWVQAMRLRTLPLALSSVWMGSAIVIEKEQFNTSVFVLATATTILLQILSNFANDYGDFKNGADNHGRVGPQRAVQSGVISARQMATAIAITALLAFLSGLALIYFALWLPGFHVAFYAFLTFGLMGILAAYFYTAGSKPYGYMGLGDVAVFIFFGVLGVCGNAFLQSPEFEWRWIWPSISIGAWSAAVLNLNNMRDRINDFDTGKMTLAVRLGARGAMRYQSILLCSAWAALALTGLCFHWRPIALVALLPLSVQIVRWLKYYKLENPNDLDRELKPTALTAALIALWLFLVA